jgi:hypothetical protein
MLHVGNFYVNRSSTSTFSQPDEASVDDIDDDEDFDEDGDEGSDEDLDDDGGSDEDEFVDDDDGGNNVSNLSSNVRLGQSLAQ